MNVNHADVHPFFEGRPTMNLDAATRPQSEHPEASENLFTRDNQNRNRNSASQGLKRFHSLLPQFEASDYDYIIFDLPPLGQTSPTVAMAGLSGTSVLLVVRVEKKSDPNAIKFRCSPNRLPRSQRFRNVQRGRKATAQVAQRLRRLIIRTQRGFLMARPLQLYYLIKPFIPDQFGWKCAASAARRKLDSVKTSLTDS